MRRRAMMVTIDSDEYYEFTVTMRKWSQLKVEVEQLREEVSRLRKALEEYAKEENWYSRGAIYNWKKLLDTWKGPKIQGYELAQEAVSSARTEGTEEDKP